MSYTQKNRPIKVKTPLGDDVLMLRAMSGSEELGRLFQFDLDLLSWDDQIKLEDVLGQSLTVELMLPNGKSRYFNGIVSRFCQVGESGEFFNYQATLHPWFWLLTRTSDCRIFQNKTVIEIIKEIFRDEGFPDFKVSLSGDYRKWEYCVQYRETDFNFISRLMEQEGIYYYFIHKDGKHILHITDSISGHDAIATPDVPYYPPSQNVERDEDYIQEWLISRALQPGAYVHRDFDFKNPKANLETKLINPFPHDRSNFEIYDYPGEYVTANEGNNYVRTRLEELQVQYEKATGEGNVCALYAGGLFNLEGYPREDQNREYLVVSATHQLQNSEYETGAAGDEEVYRCSFEVINSQQQFRPSRITPKPIVQGPQTAIVVGPAGEEIWTDEYGRVKVQFHWDRYGDADENSSCWVRVSHPWAGKNWGGIAIPRIGHEVIISFIEGDPDRPILTGRVYNANNMPPYELPANATQSGVKSRSSKGGSADNFNEIRFEDKKGSEEIYVHAEKDQNNVVKNNETIDVGVDRTITIGGNLSETIGTNTTIKVGGSHTEHIVGNMNIDIDASQTIVIASAKKETIGGPSKTNTKGAKETFNFATESKTTVGAFDAKFLGIKNSMSAAITNEVFVGAKISNQLAATAENFIGFKASACAAGQVTKTSGPYVVESDIVKIKGNVAVEISCGGSSISIKPGSITVKSSVVILDADSIQLRAGTVAMPKGNFWVKGGDAHISGKVDAKNIKG